MPTTLPAGWKPIESAPKNQLVMVYTPPQPSDWPDSVRIGFDYIDPEVADDYWYNHGEHYEHYCCVAKPENCTGPQERAPYTHWQPMPEPPCQTCNDQGAVGNVLTAEPCPDCTPPAAPTLSSLRGFAPEACDGMRSEDYVNKARNGGWSSPGCTPPASAQDDAKDEQAAFEEWLERTCPSGDVEAVQRQWEASSDYADFHAPAAGDALNVLLLTQALQELRQAFVIAVGDKSPFARIALGKADAAMAASQQQEG